MKTSNKSGVFAALRMAARAHYPLTIGTLLCVAASVIASLLPPLLLARIIDGLTAGLPLTIWAVLVYFASLALEGVLSSAQESLLVLFGQKMTHALRSEMSHKLTQLPARTQVRHFLAWVERISSRVFLLASNTRGLEVLISIPSATG